MHSCNDLLTVHFDLTSNFIGLMVTIILILIVGLIHSKKLYFFSLTPCPFSRIVMGNVNYALKLVLRIAKILQFNSSRLSTVFCNHSKIAKFHEDQGQQFLRVPAGKNSIIWPAGNSESWTVRTRPVVLYPPTFPKFFAFSY